VIKAGPALWVASGYFGEAIQIVQCSYNCMQQIRPKLITPYYALFDNHKVAVLYLSQRLAWTMNCPITGDAQSTVRDNLRGWLLKTITR